MCSSKVSSRSKVTPRSFTDLDGIRISPRNWMDRSSGRFFNSCRVPNIINFVVFGFINNLLKQHHPATLSKSYFSSFRPLSKLFQFTDINSLVSSTYDSVFADLGIVGKSLTYKLKRRGPNIDASGTPCVINFGSER